MPVSSGSAIKLDTTYIEMPLPELRILFRSDNTDGDSVHRDATPTTALMTSLAMI